MLYRVIASHHSTIRDYSEFFLNSYLFSRMVHAHNIASLILYLERKHSCIWLIIFSESFSGSNVEVDVRLTSRLRTLFAHVSWTVYASPRLMVGSRNWQDWSFVCAQQTPRFLLVPRLTLLWA